MQNISVCKGSFLPFKEADANGDWHSVCPIDIQHKLMSIVMFLMSVVCTANVDDANKWPPTQLIYWMHVKGLFFLSISLVR